MELASKSTRGRPVAPNIEPSLSIGQFLQHCSTFIKQHKVFVGVVCGLLVAIATGGYGAGYWTAMNLRQANMATGDNEQINAISKDLIVLSETTQSNFDGQAYFLDTLTDLLSGKGVIELVDAQRLLTGVIVYTYQDQVADANRKGKKSPYEKFMDHIRTRYHITGTSSFSDPNPERGILMSSDLDDLILCELVSMEEQFGLGVKFVARASAPSQRNQDRYTVEVMSARSDIPPGSDIEDVIAVRQRCTMRKGQSATVPPHHRY